MAYFAFLGWYISFLLFSCCWGAADLSVRRNPQGRLKIALDYGFATANWQAQELPALKPGQVNVVLSTHLTFSTPVSQLFTDEQLWKIGLDAFEEIGPEVNQYGIGSKYTPGATSIMAWGNEIIIATSAKGQSFTYDSAAQESPVLRDLRLCQATIASSNDRHRTGGKCGEEMAAHIYYLLNPGGRPIRQLNPQAVIGTWVAVGNDDFVQTDPCGTNFQPGTPVWGCSRFTGNGEGGQNFRVLNRNLRPATDYTIPGDVRIDQMQLCGGVFVHP